ncbi:MAG: tRNA 4-thiouridine(8) synthase ThiI [Candidatus Thermoplasmatota archaeon]|nr:tRNA 4-thiouridine(8) synthase ThiI [Candidatus Thermoplasmatota archaeon]MCL5930690.1 tRNA 4-thiouridine(8) synthase ThiI [Candidatus Thermoplasmatota archaeon]
MLTLVRYSEIGTKGDNRNYFEELLSRNIMAKLNESSIKGNVRTEESRLIVETEDRVDHILSKVFGISSFSVVEKVNSSVEEIENKISQIEVKEKFRITVNRRDKNFPMTSQQFSARLGEIILNLNPDARVDLFNFDKNIGVDIGSRFSYIYDETTQGVGGMPVRSQGKGVALISAGIDSPVAAYMMLKRGMELNLIHYFQSSRTLEKVFRNKELLEQYSPYPIEIKIMDHRKMIGKTVMELRKNNEQRWTCIFCKREMYREGENYAREIGGKAIITGEDLGQVASQTLDNLNTIEEKVNMPVFRPLIGFDKIEIERLSEKIGAFDIFLSDTSSCDCYFLPPRPRTKSSPEEMEEVELKILGRSG